MLVVDAAFRDEYGRRDVILDMLRAARREGDETFTSHRWLVESLGKRAIYAQTYGDLLNGVTGVKRVLDVGGGYSALTRLLTDHSQYTLVDLMVHDQQAALTRVQTSHRAAFWVDRDWYEFGPQGVYDVVIANDLFPNVDQRLELFLTKVLPVAREVRLVLTYYNEPRWYAVKRLDADEVFHMLAWSGQQVKDALEKYAERAGNPPLDLCLRTRPSAFPNGRQVCILRLRGDVT